MPATHTQRPRQKVASQRRRQGIFQNAASSVARPAQSRATAPHPHSRPTPLCAEVLSTSEREREQRRAHCRFSKKCSLVRASLARSLPETLSEAEGTCCSEQLQWALQDVQTARGARASAAGAASSPLGGRPQVIHFQTGWSLLTANAEAPLRRRYCRGVAKCTL